MSPGTMVEATDALVSTLSAKLEEKPASEQYESARGGGR